MPSDKHGILRRITKFLTLGALLFPFAYKGTSLPPASAHQSHSEKEDADLDDQLVGPAKIIDFKHIFVDKKNREYLDYIVNNTENQRDLGIHPDGKRNFYIKASETNRTISETFQSSEMQIIAKLFAARAPSEFPILVGEDIDHYLEEVRKGSWGTTVMSVDRQGYIHFNSISLRRFLIESDYRGDTTSLRSLVLEEFFQAQQYEEVVGGLYNSGYLETTAQLSSPESVMKAVSTENLRAFLELIQQKYLLDLKVGENSYNFSIGRTNYSEKSVSTPFEKFNGFISELQEEDEFDLLSHEDVQKLNDAFRSKYKDFYTQKGFVESQVQIWNVVGMERNNSAHPDNSLDIPTLLPLPDELNAE